MPETETRDLRGELTEVRSSLLVEAARLADMTDLKPEARADSWKQEIADARSKVMALDARFIALSRSIEPDPPVGQGPIAANRQVLGDGRETRSAGEQFVASEAYRNWAGEPGGKRSGVPGGFCEATVYSPGTRLDADLITTQITDTGFVSGGAFAPIMPFVLNPRAVRRDRLYVRDLLPQTTTTYEVINYIGETYVSGTDAGMVSEGNLKPEVLMNWYRATQNITKIAAWVPATLESLTDYGQLRGAIDNRLTYKVERKEEDELLNGSGAYPEMLGLLHVPNLQTQAFDTSTFQTITDAIALIEQHDADATGMVMNPSDYWTAMVKSSSTLTGASPFTGPPNTLWGLPVVRSPRMPVNTALLGDFKQGAEIFDREDIQIRVGDQHSDYFIRNQVAILAERREALVTYRGDVFVNITGVAH